MSIEIQPAKVSYFFDKGYRDLGSTIIEAWNRNKESFKKYWKRVQANGFFSIVGFFNIVAALSVLIGGTGFFLVASMVHSIILLSFFFMIYISFSVIWLVDRIYILKNKISSVCPNADCQEDFLIPTYQCECGAKHTRLVPSKYGILTRVCECGNKLPTTFINGREKIKARCPGCETHITTGGKSVQHSIPIIGGPSVGKTCYINMVVDKIINDVAIDKQWETEFNTEVDANNHTRAMKALAKGIRLEKTTDTKLNAYKFLVKSNKFKINRQIYVYDVAGESFSNSGDIQKNKAYNYCNGFIFMIDPLSLKEFAMEKSEINIDSYGVSTKDFDDILNVMLINLENMFGLKQKDILKRNIAVVINKCDIPGLEKTIGDSAAEKYMNENDECKDFLLAKNEVCKSFLERYGAGNFSRIVESKFKTVQYFTCSALGHNKEGLAYHSRNVEKPLLWLLESIDSDLK